MILVLADLTSRRVYGMNNSFFDQIQTAAEYLALDLSAQEMAQFAVDHEFNEENLRVIAEIFQYLQ